MIKIKELKSIFDNIEPNKRIVVDELINNAIYTADVLKQLQTKIKENGVIGYTATGNVAESPLVKSYNSLLKSYSGVIGQLIRYLPDESKLIEVDELQRFISGANE